MAQIARCPGCDSNSWRPRRRGGLWFQGEHFRRVSCRACGLVGLDPMPGPELWPLMYSDEYFAAYSVHHSSCKGYIAGREIAAAVSRKRLDKIGQHCKTGRLLDVGCAGGHFLAAARERGYEVIGVEYSPVMAKYARSTYGLEVLGGDFLEAQLSGNFDVVHMEDVLEHLSDPLAVLTKIGDVLALDGSLVVDGPLERQPSLSLALTEVNLWLRNVPDPEMAPAHIWQFTLRTQRLLLERAGFKEQQAWIYQDPAHKIPGGSTPAQKLRRRVAGGVNAVSAWVSRQAALAFLRQGDRALVIYQRAKVS